MERLNFSGCCLSPPPDHLLLQHCQCLYIKQMSVRMYRETLFKRQAAKERPI